MTIGRVALTLEQLRDRDRQRRAAALPPSPPPAAGDDPDLYVRVDWREASDGDAIAWDEDSRTWVPTPVEGVGAPDADEVSFDPSGTDLESTDVQAAIVEVAELAGEGGGTPDDGSVTDAKVAADAAIAQSKISGLTAALAGKQDVSEKGAPDGYAGLDANGLVPEEQLPEISGVPDGGTTGQALVKASEQDGDVTWATLGDGGEPVPDADETTKGLIKLAGDLGGTADEPTVPALSGKQDADPNLDAIAELSTTEFGLALLELANAAAGRSALGLGSAATQASSAFQAADSDLTAIAALTTTSFGRGLLELANAAAGRTALGAAASDDSRFPSSDEKAALVGTDGTPGAGNAFVTDSDHRLLAVTQTLTWNEDEETYEPVELLDDTSVPRVFFGPVPPVDEEGTPLPGVVMSSQEGRDIWRPSRAPAA